MDLEYNSSWRASLTDSSHVSASPLHQGLDGTAAFSRERCHGIFGTVLEEELQRNN